MKKALPLIVLLCIGWVAAVAQTPSDSFGCPLAAAYGKKNAEAFPAFDRQLREALSKQNIAALALLVKFPLRVNADHGTYYISDAAALQSQFSTVFPAIIRNAVIHRKPSDISCAYDGIDYANGEIWVGIENFGFAVKVVNLPSSSQSPTQDQIKFVCQTKKLRILVDSPQSGTWRYRSWNAGRSVLNPPNLTLNRGNHDIEGTDGCTHQIWTFKNGSTTYSVSSLGCFPDSNQPPYGARGQLEVNSSGKTHLTEWCY